MKKIDTTQFKPLYIDDSGIESWDTKESRLKELSEKVNEVIDSVNRYKLFLIISLTIINSVILLFLASIINQLN